MENCFVIQPFDNDKFDKRFSDVFEPAITKAGFNPYRIDKDLAVRIPIDEIEKGISECAICFAEITTDNPNVWYELGFAFACKKEVVLICSDERKGNFPFDIQHRHIITYKTGSTSDFINLANMITRKIDALKQTTKTVQTLNLSPVIETEGLKSHEIALMILIMENSLSKEDDVSAYYLKNEMSRAGYTNIATSLAIRTLSRSGMIESFKTFDEHNNGEYIACRLTDIGESWIFSNQEHIQFRLSNEKEDEETELPF